MPWIGNFNVPAHMIKDTKAGTDDIGDYLIITVLREYWEDYALPIVGSGVMEYKPKLVTVSHDVLIRGEREIELMERELEEVFNARKL